MKETNLMLFISKILNLYIKVHSGILLCPGGKIVNLLNFIRIGLKLLKIPQR